MFPRRDSRRSKLSDLDWNKHHNAHLATSDYDGMISVWDIDSGENILEYDEHEKRAWSVDFSKTDASLLASGSDDGTVKIYSTKQNRSVLMVETVANVCSVQYHPTNFHYVAVGCSDHQVRSDPFVLSSNGFSPRCVFPY